MPKKAFIRKLAVMMPVFSVLNKEAVSSVESGSEVVLREKTRCSKDKLCTKTGKIGYFSPCYCAHALSGLHGRCSS